MAGPACALVVECAVHTFPLVEVAVPYSLLGEGGFAGGLLPRRSPDLRPGTVLGPLGGRGLLMVIPSKTPVVCGMPFMGRLGMQIET